jgi:hypothetical protein
MRENKINLMNLIRDIYGLQHPQMAISGDFWDGNGSFSTSIQVGNGDYKLRNES